MKYTPVLRPLLLSLFGLSTANVQAQSCEGGTYLNPQTIRGEALSIAKLADANLLAVIAITGKSSQLSEASWW